MTTTISRKVCSVLLAIIIAVGVVVSPAFAKVSLAYESTGNSRFDAFINDSRWRNGASYGGDKTPYISQWTCWSCCAYTADWCKYCFDLDNPWDSTKAKEFHNAYEIKAGDVIRLGTGDATHYFAVLKRDGNRLYTAEGNMNGGKARVGWYYTIEASNKIGGENHPFSQGAGYHYNVDKPIGCIDICEAKNNQIHVAGWAFDPDESSKSIAIHVYVNNKFVTAFNASNTSSDINKTYSITGSHRFDKTFTVSDTGSITVDVYGVDSQGGPNTLLGRSPNTCTRFSLRISPASGSSACLQNGSYRIKCTNGSGKYVTATRRGSGGNVAIYSKGKGGDQVFAFKRNSDGTYTISCGVYVLDVSGAAYHGNIQLYASNQTFAQRWYVVDLGGGNYRLVSKATNCVMDISGNNTKNNTNLQTWDTNGTSAQVFRLERV